MCPWCVKNALFLSLILLVVGHCPGPGSLPPPGKDVLCGLLLQSRLGIQYTVVPGRGNSRLKMLPGILAGRFSAFSLPDPCLSIPSFPQRNGSPPICHPPRNENKSGVLTHALHYHPHQPFTSFLPFKLIPNIKNCVFLPWCLNLKIPVDVSMHRIVRIT